MSDRSEESLTAYVADFITRARAAAVPAEVTHLGKRSILDGIGLAGSAAESGHIVRRYLSSLGCSEREHRRQRRGGKSSEGCTLMCQVIWFTVPPCVRACDRNLVLQALGHGLSFRGKR